MSEDLGLTEFMALVRRFRDERDWSQFHSLRNLAAAISIEAAEQQEVLLWASDESEPSLGRARSERLADELADVLIHCANFALAAEIDLADAVRGKLEQNRQKYPIETSRGNATKYSDRTS
jgi:NTP pyrophosphatase (non-canonical NTP hydrolase)